MKNFTDLNNDLGVEYSQEKRLQINMFLDKMLEHKRYYNQANDYVISFKNGKMWFTENPFGMIELGSATKVLELSELRWIAL